MRKIIYFLLVAIFVSSLTGIVLAKNSYSQYSNPQYGFQFKYPSTWTEHQPQDSSLINQTDYLQKSASGLPTNYVIVSVKLPESKYANTNFQQAYATVAANNNIGTLDLCRYYQDIDGNLKILNKKKKYGGMTFYTTKTIGGAAAGTSAKLRIYHAFYKATCYEINFNVYIGNLANYPEGTKQVSEKKIWRQLEKVLKTWKFTKNKVQIGEKLSEEYETYIDQELKVAFDYPKSWGSIEITQPNENESKELRFRGLSETYNMEDSGLAYVAPLFFVANNHAVESEGRGGYWGDNGKLIKSENDVLNFCTGKTNCEVYKNSQDVLIAYFGDQIYYSPGTEGQKHPEYYFYNPTLPYQGVVLSAEEINSNEPDLEKKFKAVVDNIRFVK